MAVAATELFDDANCLHLECLRVAVAAGGPDALTSKSGAGQTVHSFVLNKLVSCVADNYLPWFFDQRLECINWLLEQRAPVAGPLSHMGAAHIFCGTNWSVAPRADLLVDVMGRYLECGIAGLNEKVRGSRKSHPALISAVAAGNHLATRLLLDRGADESAALKSVYRSDLVELASQYATCTHAMVTTIHEFHMKQKLGSALASASELVAPTPRRKLGV